MPRHDQDQIIPYYVLRVMIGVAGMALPLLLLLGKLIAEGSWDIEYSISDYYDNSTAGDFLVGILFALAFFLFSYKGPEPIDSKTANLGCVFALGVALCPTTSPNHTVHILHFVFAVLLFSTFIFFSIHLFRKAEPGRPKSVEKKNRNRIYFTCGVIMTVCVIAIACCQLINGLAEVTRNYQLVFWLESIALVAFGFSWITKAEVLFLKDPQTEKERKD